MNSLAVSLFIYPATILGIRKDSLEEINSILYNFHWGDGKHKVSKQIIESDIEKSGLKMLEAVKLFSHVANIGDTRSLILHPASTTHRQLTEEQRIAAGAGQEVIRLSIGIECVEDIISDLDQALNCL